MKKSKNLATKNAPSTENVTHNINSETLNTKQPKINDGGNNYKENTTDWLDVTALVAIMEPATESQS